jgi:hypothetical protein
MIAYDTAPAIPLLTKSVMQTLSTPRQMNIRCLFVGSAND